MLGEIDYQLMEWQLSCKNNQHLFSHLQLKNRS